MSALAETAAAARLLFAFDAIWWLRREDGGALLTFAGPDGAEESAALPGEAAVELRAAAGGPVPDGGTDPLAAELSKRGMKSFLAVPVGGAAGIAVGILGFAARDPGALTSAQEGLARAAAIVLREAAERERAAAGEREARRHLDVLAKLLPTVAATLDVREVFLQISEIAKAVLPHDAMGIQIIQPDRKTILAYVVSDAPAGDSFDYGISLELNETDMTDAFVEDVRYDPDPTRAAIVRGRMFPPAAGPEGVPVEVPMDARRSTLARKRGYRSFLRVGLHRGDEIIGSLVFASPLPGHFRPAQFDSARRIADYVAMVLAHRELAQEAERAAEARARAAMLEERVRELVRAAEERQGLHRCVGESRAWKDVLTQATRVAPTDTTVLLTGESGTGKEVIARFIHRGSARSNGPLVAVNCAALPEQLLESELFGYERGAFSGALNAKPGRIEQAARGVLFLDEIGEMSLSLQAKLLRVLQEKEFQRLGGTKTLKADVRVIAATNRDLVAAMKRNEFREDLFYRLRVFEIRLPPLRERRDDILPLTEALLADLENAVGRRTAGLSREAREILLTYDWPGNVRELRNALERAVILCDGGLITGEQLPLGVGEVARTGNGNGTDGDMRVDTAEKELIEKALRQAGNNKSRAARLLGLSRAQLYFRLEKYGFLEPGR